MRWLLDTGLLNINFGSEEDADKFFDWLYPKDKHKTKKRD